MTKTIEWKITIEYYYYNLQQINTFKSMWAKAYPCHRNDEFVHYRNYFRWLFFICRTESLAILLNTYIVPQDYNIESQLYCDKEIKYDIWYMIMNIQITSRYELGVNDVNTSVNIYQIVSSILTKHIAKQYFHSL